MTDPSPPSATADAPPSLGAILDVAPSDNGVTLLGLRAQLHLQFLSDTVVRLRWAPRGSSTDAAFSYALDPNRTWPGPSSLTVDADGEAIRIRTAALTIQTPRDACRLHVLDADGAERVEALTGPDGSDGEAYGTNGASSPDGAALSLRLRPGERLLGLGDKAFALDRRGQRVEHWNTDAFKFQFGTDPLYKSIPFLLALHDGAGYGLFVDAPGRTAFDLGAEASDRLRIEAPGDTLDAYLFLAPSPLGIARDFARLTGLQAMLPKWALGYHQCRYSYRDEAEIRDVAREFRERQIPCDVLYFDIHYMDGYRVFTWDPEAFPDPPALLADLQAQGFRSVVIIDPGVKADDPAYAVAQDGLARDAFLRFPDGTPFVGTVWPGPCYFPDYTRPDVRDWWGALHRDLVAAGVDGIWNDMNEPAVFSIPHADGSMEAEEEVGTVPDEVRHAFEGHGSDHATAHNVYGMQMLRATYEGLARLAPERRPFTITRAAYAGTQRFGTAWTGDNFATWDHLKLAIRQCLSLNLSGMPFVGADVGGFSGIPDGELLARWTQLGALTPLFRNHSAIDTPHQEPWRFGEEVERVCRDAIGLRMRLLPYLYTVLFEAATEGLPMLRALPLLHPDDETVRCTSPLGFYVGRDLLAHPVVEAGQRSREVYLPASPGGWFDFHTGRHHEARSTVWIDTPLDHLPLYVRAGSVLPMQPVLQHTREAPVDVLTLRVYPRPGPFSARLFEDAGDGWGFRHGEAWIGTIQGDDSGDRLTLRTRVEGRFVPTWTTWAWEVEGTNTSPARVLVEGAPIPFRCNDGVLRFETPVGADVVIER